MILQKFFICEGKTSNLKYQEAERYYQKARVVDDQNPLYLDAYATMLWKMGRYAEGEPFERRALLIRERVAGKRTSGCCDEPEQSGGIVLGAGKVRRSRAAVTPLTGDM